MPHDGANIAQAIRASGRRLTIQRALILEALHRLPGHCTAEQIYASVCEDHRNAEMAVSTVYRALDTLAEMGILTAFVGSGGVTTYEWASAGAPHHHLLCERCGHAEEVALASLSALAAEAARDHGFAVDLRHMAIRGLCARCEREREARG